MLTDDVLGPKGIALHRSEHARRTEQLPLLSFVGPRVADREMEIRDVGIEMRRRLPSAAMAAGLQFSRVRAS